VNSTSERAINTSEQRIVHTTRTKAHCTTDDKLLGSTAKLSRFTAVAFEQSAKSLFASNVGERNCRPFVRVRFGLSLFAFLRADPFVVQALLRSFLKIMDSELLAKNIHVLVTEDDEMVKLGKFG
jgi:hypothetical protein